MSSSGSARCYSTACHGAQKTLPHGLWPHSAYAPHQLVHCLGCWLSMIDLAALAHTRAAAGLQLLRRKDVWAIQMKRGPRFAYAP